MEKKLSALKYALWLLEKSDRSIGEMEEKLKRREYSPDEISQTLQFLISKEFLNDERFAANFVRFKKSIKPVGKYYLQQKLIQKKIPKEIIEKVLLDAPDETEEISELVDRWLSKNAKVPKEKIYEKLTRHLLSRGFEWEKVREVIAEKL